jgi:tetratricopeptide (TPR) repeat protein
MKNIRFYALLILAAICLSPLLIIAAEDAPAQPPEAAPAEKPAEAVNGLTAELKVLNAPLYPGDDLQLDIRLTNVPKEGDIQLVDYPMFWSAFHPVCIGPDGQQINWPVPMIAVKPPDAPTATLAPGSFYGRKITLGAADLKKPGKYAISLRYSNGIDLKDKGFNCWTGNLQSNTTFFEVPDFTNVPAVDGIQMLVKMNPQYREDQPVMVGVRFYNSGNKEKEVLKLGDKRIARFPQYYCDGTVKDEKGTVIKWKTLGDVMVATSMLEKVSPGQAVIGQYDLRGACDLPLGKYTLQLHTAGFPPLGSVTSNEVSFEILPAAKPLSKEEKGKVDELVNEGTKSLEMSVQAEVAKAQVAPDSAEAKAFAEAQVKWLQKAEQSFYEALNIDPQSMAAHHGLCMVLAKLGKYDEAIEHGLVVLKNAPDRVAIYSAVAAAYMLKGTNSQGDEQIKNYENAVSIIMEYYPKDTNEVSQAHVVMFLGEICGKIASLSEGPDKIKQYDRIIEVVGNYLKEHPDNTFADQMKSQVDAATKNKNG